jgi:ABC-type lipoprotein export system ATPase subunit
MPLLAAENLQKIYVTGEARVSALAGVSFEVEAGDFVALMGPSGCGKSTLLHIAGAMDRQTSGTLRLQDRELSSMGDDELTRVRREQVGFVFQFFNLLPTLTVGDNIALPCLLAGMKDQDAERRAGRSLSASASPIASRITRSRSPGAKCSAPRSRARSCTSRRCSLPTSRRATSIPRTAPTCWPSSPGSTKSSASPS